LKGFGYAYLALGTSMFVMLVIAFGLKKTAQAAAPTPTTPVST
jgi:hypothetical protein